MGEREGEQTFLLSDELLVSIIEGRYPGRLLMGVAEGIGGVVAAIISAIVTGGVTGELSDLMGEVRTATTEVALPLTPPLVDLVVLTAAVLLVVAGETEEEDEITPVDMERGAVGRAGENEMVDGVLIGVTLPLALTATRGIVLLTVAEGLLLPAVPVVADGTTGRFLPSVEKARGSYFCSIFSSLSQSSSNMLRLDNIDLKISEGCARKSSRSLKYFLAGKATDEDRSFAASME